MNDLYRNELSILQNLFLPSMKLISKSRLGSKLKRRYDKPQPPLERVAACPEADPLKLAQLQKLREVTDPFALAKIIEQKLSASTNSPTIASVPAPNPHSQVLGR